MKCFIGVFGSSGLRPRITCGWLTHGIHVVCAPRAIQNLIAVSAPRAGDFSLLVQREVTKRKHARMARHLLASRLAAWEVARQDIPVRAGDRRDPSRRPSGSRRSAARLGAPYGSKKNSVPRIEVGGSPPRSARRVPQPEREFSSEPLFESSRVVGGRRVGERPLGRGTEGVFARSGVCFFWLLFFAQAKKSNLPWVSHPQVHTRAKPARQNNITPLPNPLPQGERGSKDGGASHEYASPQATQDHAQRAMP
jgi:hypothetical protein